MVIRAPESSGEPKGIGHQEFMLFATLPNRMERYPQGVGCRGLIFLRQRCKHRLLPIDFDAKIGSAIGLFFRKNDVDKLQVDRTRVLEGIVGGDLNAR